MVEAINPSTLLKSRKSERRGRIHPRGDGAGRRGDVRVLCLVRAGAGRRGERGRITELTVDERLGAARASRPGFVGLSFATIAGFNANGAMPHYRATPESHAVIDVADGDGLLLIDSGGQYLGGTTDITRVWPIGTVSAAQRRDYTLVLKGTMALSRARFPRGTLSPMLDALARAPLWADGPRFRPRHRPRRRLFPQRARRPAEHLARPSPSRTMAMEPGMITAIEPGLYRPGQWGVRIENLVLNVPAPPTRRRRSASSSSSRR